MCIKRSTDNNEHNLPKAYLNRLNQFIITELKKPRTKPLLFVISEIHNVDLFIKQELKIIESIKENCQKGDKLKLFLELDKPRYWSERVETATRSFFATKLDWGDLINNAKRHNFSVIPVDTNFPILSFCLRVIFLISSMHFIIGLILYGFVGSLIFSPSLLALTVIIATASCLILDFFLDFSNYLLTPAVHEQAICSRDTGMVENITTEKDFTIGILVIGFRHANGILQGLHKRKEIEIVSIALTSHYPEVVKEIPKNILEDIPVFLASNADYQHGSSLSQGNGVTACLLPSLEASSDL